MIYLKRLLVSIHRLLLEVHPRAEATNHRESVYIDSVIHGVVLDTKPHLGVNLGFLIFRLHETLPLIQLSFFFVMVSLPCIIFFFSFFFFFFFFFGKSVKKAGKDVSYFKNCKSVFNGKEFTQLFTKSLLKRNKVHCETPFVFQHNGQYVQIDQQDSSITCEVGIFD